MIEFQLHAGSPVSYMERPFILEYKRQQYGAWFSKRGSVDLCFPSETLSLVYIDNGDWVKCAVFYFLQNFRISSIYFGFKCNLNDENSPMLIKISCKVHICSTYLRIGFTWASPVEFWSEVCHCYYLYILGDLVFMIFWQ